MPHNRQKYNAILSDLISKLLIFRQKFSKTIFVRGGSRIFIWGAKDCVCARTNIMSVKPEVPYGRGPGPEALGFFDAPSCYLSLIFKHSDTKWDTTNGRSAGAPSGSATVRNIQKSPPPKKKKETVQFSYNLLPFQLPFLLQWLEARSSLLEGKFGTTNIKVVYDCNNKKIHYF